MMVINFIKPDGTGHWSPLKTMVKTQYSDRTNTLCTKYLQGLASGADRRKAGAGAPLLLELLGRGQRGGGLFG